MVGICVIVVFCLFVVIHSHTAEEWKTRTIFQVLTDRIGATGSATWSSCKNLSVYCGGTFKGIEDRLDYIKGMGFDAIWISPIPENLGNDYHGYAFLDLYKINDHFGTEAELKHLISTAHQKGIWVMLDVVANHVAPVDLDYSKINPFNSSDYYHYKCQIENWNDQGNVEYCRLANLPDLDQNHQFVRKTLLSWVSSLKANLNVDGLRIDTVPEVHPDFWSEFSSAAGMFTLGEVFQGSVSYVSGYQQYMDGVLSYPLYFTLLDVFARKQPMWALESMLGPSGSYRTHFKNLDYLGTFVDNHDNARFLNLQPSYTLYKNALTMTLFTQGIPIVYYGTEQGYSGGADPANRESLWPNYSSNHELYQFITQLNGIRSKYLVSISSNLSSQIQRYASSNFYAFSRGNILVCLTNTGGSTVTINVSYLPYSVGTKICNVLSSSSSSQDCMIVESWGINVSLNGGLPKIYVPSN